MLTLGTVPGSCFQLAGRQTRRRSSKAYRVRSRSTYCGELSLRSGALHKVECLDIYRGCSDYTGNCDAGGNRELHRGMHAGENGVHVDDGKAEVLYHKTESASIGI